MSQIARLVSLSSPSVAGSTRPVKGGRSALHAGNADPIEALNPQPGVSYNDAALAYEDEGNSSSRHRERFSSSGNGVFATQSQSFAAMIETPYESQAGAMSFGARSKFMNVLFSRAIGIYETNARIVSGNEKSIGSSLNITL